MSIRNLIVPAIGLVGALLLPLAAQAQAPMMGHDHNVYQRLHNERTRIREGVRHGNLNYGEAMRLQHRDARVQRMAAHDRFMHGGHLTDRERMRLNSRLNRTSGAIYRHKHDIGTH